MRLTDSFNTHNVIVVRVGQKDSCDRFGNNFKLSQDFRSITSWIND